MAAFQEMAPAWAAAGIVPLPITPDGKRPMVKQPGKFGRPAAMALAAKPRFAEANLGFWCGAHNRVTVVDIDSPANSELQHALETYGDSPIIVQTPSGGRHVYYAHNDEPRSVRPDKRHPIDMLGGGLCVAPPSRKLSGDEYKFLRGGLADLRGLPRIRAGAVPIIDPSPHLETPQSQPAAAKSGAIEPGRRNDTLFRMACTLARDVETKAALLDQIRRLNAELADPLPDAEVQRAGSSAWRYKIEGRLMTSGYESSLIFPAKTLDRLLQAGQLDVYAIVSLARRHHSEPGKVFALAPRGMVEAGVIKGWSRNRYRTAIRKACELGELVQVTKGGRGKATPQRTASGLGVCNEPQS